MKSKECKKYEFKGEAMSGWYSETIDLVIFEITRDLESRVNIAISLIYMDKTEDILERKQNEFEGLTNCILSHPSKSMRDREDSRFNILKFFELMVFPFLMLKFKDCCDPIEEVSLSEIQIYLDMIYHRVYQIFDDIAEDYGSKTFQAVLNYSDNEDIRVIDILYAGLEDGVYEFIIYGTGEYEI